MIDKFLIICMFFCMTLSALALAAITIIWLVNEKHRDRRKKVITSLVPFLILFPSYHVENVRNKIEKCLYVFLIATILAAILYVSVYQFEITNVL